MAEGNTEEAALKEAGVEASPANQQEFQTNGRTPGELTGHECSGEYCMFGVTPDEAATMTGQQMMDYPSLVTSASLIIDDMDKPLEKTVKSRALQFSIYVLYTMGPESRSVKSGTNTKDKIWKCKVIYNDSGKSDTRMLIVATHKNTEAKPVTTTKNLLVLSVKQATLLAMYKFKEYVKYSFNLIPSRVLLTPLAGAVYTAADIKFMSLIKGSLALEDGERPYGGRCETVTSPQETVK